MDDDRKTVIISGLSGDCFRKPFGQILDCIPYADDVTWLSAFCDALVLVSHLTLSRLEGFVSF